VPASLDTLVLVRRTRHTLAALGAIAASGACTLLTDTDGLTSPAAGSTSSSSSSSSGSSGSSVPDAEASSSGAPSDAAAVRADVVVDPVTGLPRSCKDLRGVASGDGVHRIDADGPGPAGAVDAYCEMSTEGGGWTLVARTVAGATGEIGWDVARGSVLDDTQAYSFGAAVLELAFTEVLLAARGDGKTLGAHAYKLGITPLMLQNHSGAAFAGYSVATVLGNCSPPGAPPSMLRHAGFTRKRTSYFFRDIDRDENYGLLPDRLNTNYDDCNRGGRLHLKQGMLFVR
jgi:hypothetical protein